MEDPIKMQGHERHTIPCVGITTVLWQDLYHRTLTISWPVFLSVAVSLYLLTNAVFAALYLLQDASILNARPGSFADAFFFSVQTLGTIGYGVMSPGTLYANILVTAEVVIELVVLALLTGVMFARFSQPSARVLFSNVAVVEAFHGVPTLMFRCANLRGNQILEAEMRVTLLRNERSPEGHELRRFHDLKLLRSRTSAFSLGWMVMHAIDENSPLWACSATECADQDASLIVSLMGTDETFAQTVHARHNYGVNDILWQHRFVDVSTKNAQGERYVDYRHFHQTIALAARPTAP